MRLEAQFHLFSLRTSCWWLANFTPRSFYSWETRRLPLIGCLHGPQIWSETTSTDRQNTNNLHAPLNRNKINFTSKYNHLLGFSVRRYLHLRQICSTTRRGKLFFEVLNSGGSPQLTLCFIPRDSPYPNTNPRVRFYHRPSPPIRTLDLLPDGRCNYLFLFFA